MAVQENSNSVLVADIALDPKDGGRDALYTYRVESEVSIGSAFLVPFGSRQVLGFVTDVYRATEEDLGFSFEQLKSLGEPIAGAALPEASIHLAQFVAQDTLCPLSVALSAAIPTGIRERLVSSWSIVGDAPEKKKKNELRLELQDDLPLTTLQREVLRSLRDAGGTIFDKPPKRLDAKTVKALKLLEHKRLVKQETRVLPWAEGRSSLKLYRLTTDSAWVERFIKVEAKKKPAQALTLLQMQEAGEEGQSGLSAGEIRALAGVTDTTIKALIVDGLLEPVDPRSLTPVVPPTPNPSQSIAIDAIVASIEENVYKSFLLYGVTGSGKTEVYLRSAAAALRQGRQVLYLVPEIALATHAISKLRERFGQTVAVLHSELSPRERLQTFQRIRDGQAALILGARSALFAPLTNLGLIIMDEEHEASYKQESAPRYHAKRVATYLAETNGCPLVLGSATPSLESFYAAESETLELLTLPQRAASAVLPEVFVEDLAEGYRIGEPSMFSLDLQTRMKATLEAGNQIILFLNRRAYAPFLLCRDCGEQMMCPRCSVSLSYHRGEGNIRCHHCGFRRPLPDKCPKCDGLRLSPFGVGTEKVEEAARAMFPGANVARLDRDVARRKGALEEVLAQFRSGDIQILVGTQMVAKGLDFPNVTLVGVIAADVSLNFPDFRAAERTFQLLSQVAGRAGRGRKPGQVVIQTFNPQHFAIQTAQRHDYLGFYDTMKLERNAAAYPPFNRLTNIIVTGEVREAVTRASDSIRDQLSVEAKGEILGPVDCVLERIAGKWRRHLLVKSEPDASVAWIEQSLLGLSFPDVQMTIDVDPYSLM